MTDLQHEITITPYEFEGDQHPYIFGATCTCQWLWMPNALDKTTAAIRAHYEDAGMATPTT